MVDNVLVVMTFDRATDVACWLTARQTLLFARGAQQQYQWRITTQTTTNVNKTVTNGPRTLY